MSCRILLLLGLPCTSVESVGFSFAYGATIHAPPGYNTDHFLGGHRHQKQNKHSIARLVLNDPSYRFDNTIALTHGSCSKITMNRSNVLWVWPTCRTYGLGYDRNCQELTLCGGHPVGTRTRVTSTLANLR